MARGFVKLHREALESYGWTSLTPQGKVVFITILANCNWKESKVTVEGVDRILLPGQWLTSIPTIKKLSGKGITDKNIRTAIAGMKLADVLADEVTKGNHRIITVNNWLFYQSAETSADEVADEVAAKWQNPKKVRKARSKRTTLKEPSAVGSENKPPAPTRIVSDHYVNRLKQYNQTMKINWANFTKRTMSLLEVHTPEEVCEIIDFAFKGVQDNGYWVVRPAMTVNLMFTEKMLNAFATSRATSARIKDKLNEPLPQ